MKGHASNDHRLACPNVSLHVISEASVEYNRLMNRWLSSPIGQTDFRMEPMQGIEGHMHLPSMTRSSREWENAHLRMPYPPLLTAIIVGI